MDEVLALIGRAHQGDKEARDTLVEKNTGLVHSIVKRFFKSWSGDGGFISNRNDWAIKSH